MWMTPDGVTHTNAHATPRQAVTEPMWASLVSIGLHEGEAASDVVHEGFLALLEAIGEEEVDLSELDPELEGEWIPDGYLDGEFATSTEVRGYLDSLPISWRMDAFMVVGDILDDLTAPSRWQRFRGLFRSTRNT